jgi:hypothetical protein
MKSHHRWADITLLVRGSLTLMEAVAFSVTHVEKRESYLNWIAALILTLYSCFPSLSVAAENECPLERALDYNLAMVLASDDNRNIPAGTPAASAALQAAHDKAVASLPRSCRDEIKAAQVDDLQCENLNYAAVEIEAKHISTVSSNYDKTGNRQAYARDMRAIFRRIMLSVPHRCWFQIFKVTPPPSSSPSTPPSQPDIRVQCQELQNNYKACRKQVERALQKCASQPGPCKDRGPICILPSSVLPGCSP